MKKISAIAAVFLMLAAIFYISNIVRGGKADTAPSSTYPCGGTITSSSPFYFYFDMGSYSTVNLKVFKNGSEVRHKDGVTSPVCECDLLGSNGQPDGMLTQNGSDYSWRIYGTTGQKLVSELCGFTISRTQ